MPYEFKSITDIEAINTISENINLLAEQGGKAVRVKSAVIPKLNDTEISENKIWSSKKTINSLCPTLEEKELIVKCLPLAESPLEVSSYIESKQNGTGTPSPDNICPISGWNDTIQLVKHGKNLIPFPYAEGGEGTVIQRNGITFTVLPNRGIKIKGTAETGTYFVLQRECDYGDVVMDAMSSPTGHSNGKYAVSHRLYYNSTNKTLSLNIAKGTAVNEVVYPQIEVGTVSTNYEPYQKDVYSMDLNETIYGSYYNWTTGTLTKTHEIITLTGNEAFYKNSDRTQYYYGHGKSNGALSNPMCSHFKGDYRGAYNNNIANTVAVRGTLVWLYTPQFNTVTDLKAYLAAQYNAGTPVTIVYQMEEPTSNTQFEPINIEAIDGENIIYSDCGETKVKYDADIKKYVDKAIEEATRENEYELIETIVCDGTYGNISRTNLELKQMILYINTKAAEAAASIGVEVRNEKELFGYLWVANGVNTAERWTYVKAVSDGQWAYLEGTGAITSSYGSSGVSRTGKRFSGGTPIQRVGIYTNGSVNFPAETTIEIWGVRANA